MHDGGEGEATRPEGGDEGALRVLVAADHALVGESLAMVFDAVEGVEVVGVGHTPEEAVELARTEQPEVALLDLRSPGASNGTIGRVVAAAPGCRVLVLRAESDERARRHALFAGPHDAVPRDERLEDVLASLGIDIDTAEPEPVLARVEPKVAKERKTSSGLTAREREVLRLMASGLTNKAIAEQLVVSLNTVRAHVQNILRKLGAHSKLEAVASATRNGVLLPVPSAPPDVTAS